MRPSSRHALRKRPQHSTVPKPGPLRPRSVMQDGLCLCLQQWPQTNRTDNCLNCLLTISVTICSGFLACSWSTASPPLKLSAGWHDFSKGSGLRNVNEMAWLLKLLVAACAYAIPLRSEAWLHPARQQLLGLSGQVACPTLPASISNPTRPCYIPPCAGRQ